MARAIELESLTDDGPTFRVWCSTLRRYVLSNVTAASVRSYYEGISRSRAAAHAEAEMQGALDRGLLPPRRAAAPAGGH